jgi:NAD+ synthase (glutamine-hydrolysing)
MTMDGDTSGGFNPIGSLSKAHLLRLLEWLSNNSIDGMEPISGLKATLKLQPSAELRPLIEQQTDEKDLMPYNVLEIIERLALQKKYSAVDVKAQLFEECNGSYSVTECHNFVDRFFTLWQQSQWKREKLPLSLHISDFNLDPRSGFRFPVLSAKI